MNVNKSIVFTAKIATAIVAGTAFAGFDYPTRTGGIRRRNVTVGSDLSKFITGGKSNWGQAFANGSLVAYRGKTYLQGVENNLESGKKLKRFALDRIENLKIG